MTEYQSSNLLIVSHVLTYEYMAIVNNMLLYITLSIKKKDNDNYFIQLMLVSILLSKTVLYVYGHLVYIILIMVS